MDSEAVEKTALHLSKWNSSLVLNNGTRFPLAWGKDGAGRILVSKIDFS